MLEARELFLGSFKNKFFSDEYLKDLEIAFESFSKSGKEGLLPQLSFLKDLTRYVFGIEFSDEEVLYHWNEIFSIKKELVDKDVRVIAFDYFLRGGLLYNPKVIEMKKFMGIMDMLFQDYKTFSYNYHMFRIIVNYEIEKVKRYGGYFSIIMMDLDNFKFYNDKYGHQFGDEILQEFTKVVMSCIRKSDVIFRYGGDEFIVFCPETKRIGARVVAEKIKDAVSSYFSDKGLDMSVSIGIAVFPFDAEDFEELISFADKMLYHSKKFGKNRITDRFDYVDVDDRRRFPRILVKKPSSLTFKDGDILVECNVIDVSKSGILVKCEYPVSFKSEIVEVHKIKIGDSEFILDMFVRLARSEGNFIAIDFNENKVFETIVYLFDS